MKKRYIAHITIEAQTPLKVGGTHSDFLQDRPVQKDFNNLPMILGSSIAGVLRKDFGEKEDEIFGKESGSKVIFSNALLVDEKGEVSEKLLTVTEKLPFLAIFENLPIREHTAITDKGVTAKGSKFDEEVVYKGSRFRFAIEMIEDEEAFEKLLTLLSSSSFRLGGGTTKGFGKFKIIYIARKTIDSIEDMVQYSSSLNSLLPYEEKEYKTTESTTYFRYLLRLEPEDFFMFGSGFGDNEADMTPVYEKVVDYKNKTLSDKYILIPATSIKGALAHRTAFHYNKAIGATIESGNAKVGEKNQAVKALFGHKKELAKDKKTELGQKGKVMISDCFKVQKKSHQTKVFDHVSIDRFTGGARDGAIFQEKTISDDRIYEIEILVDNSLKNTEELRAFKKALDDVCTGMLALGGSTTKGHGVFEGSIS